MVRAYTRRTPISRGRGKLIQLAERMAPKPDGDVVARVADVGSMALDLTQLVDRYIYYCDTFEPEVGEALRHALRPGGVAVDVGANIGYMTLVMARLVGPGGRVLAVEPSPVVLPRLRRNLALNDLPQVVLDTRAAVAEAHGAYRVLPTVAGDHGSIMLLRAEDRAPGWAESTDAIDVRGAPLDTMLADHGLTRVDALKMDIEGFELQALRGGERMIGRDRPVIVLEVNPRCLAAHGVRSTDLTTWLDSHGYVVRPIGPHAHLDTATLASSGTTYNAIATRTD